MNVNSAFVTQLITSFYPKSGIKDESETIEKVALVAFSSLFLVTIFFIVFRSRRFSQSIEITKTERAVQCISAKQFHMPIEQELIELFPLEERCAVSEKIQNILTLWQENPCRDSPLKKLIQTNQETQVFHSFYELCEEFIPDSPSIVNNLIEALLSIETRLRPQAIVWMKKIFAANNKEKNEYVISSYLVLFIQSMKNNDDVDIFIEYFRLYGSMNDSDEIHCRRNGLGQNNLSCFEKHSSENRMGALKIIIHASRSDRELRNIIFDLIHDCGLLKINIDRVKELSEFVITHKENQLLLAKFGDLIDLTLGSLLENFIPYSTYDEEARKNAKSNIEARKKAHAETKLKVKQALLELNLDSSKAEAHITSFFEIRGSKQSTLPENPKGGLCQIL